MGYLRIRACRSCRRLFYRSAYELKQCLGKPQLNIAHASAAAELAETAARRVCEPCKWSEVRGAEKANSAALRSSPQRPLEMTHQHCHRCHLDNRKPCESPTGEAHERHSRRERFCRTVRLGMERHHVPLHLLNLLCIRPPLKGGALIWAHSRRSPRLVCRSCRPRSALRDKADSPTGSLHGRWGSCTATGRYRRNLRRIQSLKKTPEGVLLSDLNRKGSLRLFAFTRSVLGPVAPATFRDVGRF